MLRKIRRNIARNQLIEEGHKKINKKYKGESDFQLMWKDAYVRGIQKILQKNGKRVVVRRNG